jgi:hypothetical protein
MACHVLIEGKWTDGWIKGMALAGCIAVTVAGITHNVHLESVRIADGANYRQVTLKEIGDHVHAEIVPGPPQGQSVPVASGTISTTTTTPNPNQPPLT